MFKKWKSKDSEEKLTTFLVVGVIFGLGIMGVGILTISKGEIK